MKDKSFNWKIHKEARRGTDPPEAFLPPIFRDDPYIKGRPGKGKGDKMTTPGDEGMLGSTPDISAPAFGTKEREGYPRGLSQNEDPGDRPIGEEHNYNIPADTDPDDLFGKDRAKSREPEYGTGLATDHGMLMHDTPEQGIGESPLGVHDTTVRKGDGNDRDRVSPMYNLESQKPLFNRIRGRQRS